MSEDSQTEKKMTTQDKEAVEAANESVCQNCKIGFPKNWRGEHYGTQSLGMIPNVKCALEEKQREKPVNGELEGG